MRTRQIEGSESFSLRCSIHKVALLTNLIPPYQKPLYALLTERYASFRLFLSTSMEENRPWAPEWPGLDVTVQRSFSVRRKRHYARGFAEPSAIHFPIDTFFQLKRFRPDAVVSVEMGFRTLLAYLYSRMRRDCRFLIWSEVTEITERGGRSPRCIVRRFLAKRADAFLALGRAGASYVHALGAPERKIFQFSYTTNLEPFADIPLDRDGPAATRLLFSGQLIERKGLKPFLAVLNSWAKINFECQMEFWLIGDGAQRYELEQLPRVPNVKLNFIGNVDYDRLPDIYSHCGILVLPSLADAWGVVVNEALASGIPVLGSVYSQAVAEMVEEGKNGWTFRPDHPEGMYGALEAALSCKASVLNSMRRYARASAMKVTPKCTADVFVKAVQFAQGGV